MKAFTFRPTRWIAMLVSAASVLTMLTLAGAGPASALSLQPPQSISNLVITPRGTTINVKFHLFYAAIPTVALRRADDVRPLSATPYAIGGRVPAKDWNITVRGLKPNTAYPGTATRPKFVYNHNVAVKTWHRWVKFDSDGLFFDGTGDPSGCSGVEVDVDRSPGYETNLWDCEFDGTGWASPPATTIKDAPAVVTWAINVKQDDQHASASHDFVVTPNADGYESYSQYLPMTMAADPGTTFSSMFLAWVTVWYEP